MSEFEQNRAKRDKNSSGPYGSILRLKTCLEYLRPFRNAPFLRYDRIQSHVQVGAVKRPGLQVPNENHQDPRRDFSITISAQRGVEPRLLRLSDPCIMHGSLSLRSLV